MNYFELFDIPVNFRVDKNLVAKKYFELQKQFHPDFFLQADDDEQASVLEKSSQINKALKVLKNETETIKYVLLLKGILEDEEKYQLPPEFLMEVMEVNEGLSESSKKQVNTLETEIYEPVKDIIENFRYETTTTEELLKVKEYYYKKKYLQRILDRLDG